MIILILDVRFEGFWRGAGDGRVVGRSRGAKEKTDSMRGELAAAYFCEGNCLLGSEGDGG